MTSSESTFDEHLRISEKKSNSCANQDKGFVKISNDESELFTTEALVDALFLNLAGVREVVTNKQNGKQVTVRKHYRQALELMYRIPVSEPSPSFIISVADLNPQIQNELGLIKSQQTMRYVLTQAVGRVFENLNFEYFHLSIAKNLRVRLEK